MIPEKTQGPLTNRHTFANLALVGVALTVCNVWLRGQNRVESVPSAKATILPVEISQRIATLKHSLANGDRSALDVFWKEVRQAGSPLIEPFADSPGEAIVTFIWRGNVQTQNVALQAPLASSPGMPTLALAHLVETDVWYRCWLVRDDLRFSYRFLVDMKPGENPEQSARVDQLNPHRMEISLDEGATSKIEYSVASMPHAPDESSIIRRPGVPSGLVVQHRFKSAILGNERSIWTYTPASYNARAERGYPLLVLLDGFSYQDWIPTPVILDNLIHSGKVQPMIAVLIGNARDARSSELGFNPALVEFLSKEVLPWVREHWNVTRDPQKSIVGGYSFGGSAATFVALRRPDLFGKVLSQSGAFWRGNDADVKWEWLIRQYEAAPRLPLRFYLEAGVLEDVSRDGPTLLAANRHLAAVLKRRGYTVDYQEVGGTHEPAQWRGQLAPGILSLTK